MTSGDAMARLAWLQLQDSAFPVGRFVQSNGLEAWLAAYPEAGEEQIAELARAHLAQAVATLDAVVLARAWDCTDVSGLFVLDRLLGTYKLAAAARTASMHSGRQFALIARRIVQFDAGHAFVDDYLDAVLAEATPGHQAVVEGTVHRNLGVSRVDSVLGFLRSTHAGFLSAAVRLGRLGSISAQQVLLRERSLIAELTEAALTTGLDDLTTCTPELEIHAMRHETSEMRLFTT
jgi:urease accessory protein